MAKAPPSFDFFYNDWAGGTFHMTHIERDCYLSLLIYQWQNGHIPDQECDRMDICRIVDIGQWRKIWQKLRVKFGLFENGDSGQGEWRNERMHIDRDKSIKRWEANRMNGKKGGRPKADKSYGESEDVKGDNRMVLSRLTQKEPNGKEEGGRRKELQKEILSTLDDKLKSAVVVWLEHKAQRGDHYKPEGLKALVGRVRNLAEAHGASEIIDAFERAKSNGHVGWEYGIGKGNHGRKSDRNFEPPPASTRIGNLNPNAGD